MGATQLLDFSPKLTKHEAKPKIKFDNNLSGDHKVSKISSDYSIFYRKNQNSLSPLPPSFKEDPPLELSLKIFFCFKAKPSAAFTRVHKFWISFRFYPPKKKYQQHCYLRCMLFLSIKTRNKSYHTSFMLLNNHPTLANKIFYSNKLLISQ